MSQYILDCSVTMRWLFRDEATPAADALYLALQKGLDQAFVPSLFYTEMLNALLVGERRARCRPDEAERFFTSVLGLPIAADDHPDPSVLRRIRDLARTHGLTSYDASYLESAQVRALPLASYDGPLRDAADRIGIPLVI